MTALDFEDRKNIKDAHRIPQLFEQADQGSNPLKRRLLLRRFWKGASGFWLKGGGRLSSALTAGIFAIALLGLATSYGINIWNRAIFDALERRDAGTVVFWSIVYFPLLAASVCKMRSSRRSAKGAIPTPTQRSAGRCSVLLRGAPPSRCAGAWPCWLAALSLRPVPASRGPLNIGRMTFRCWQRRCWRGRGTRIEENLSASSRADGRRRRARSTNAGRPAKFQLKGFLGHAGVAPVPGDGLNLRAIACAALPSTAPGW
jgi:hypothetical protein